MLNNDLRPIIQEFGSYSKSITPHPIYRIMRYGTPVTWNGIVYTNIEYALSEYRRELETGVANTNGMVAFIEEDIVPLEDKSYAFASVFHDHVSHMADGYDWLPPSVVKSETCFGYVYKDNHIHF